MSPAPEGSPVRSPFPRRPLLRRRSIRAVRVFRGKRLSRRNVLLVAAPATAGACLAWAAGWRPRDWIWGLTGVFWVSIGLLFWLACAGACGALALAVTRAVGRVVTGRFRTPRADVGLPKPKASRAPRRLDE